MCVSAEVVINRKQEQPAAKKHCTYRHLFNSPHTHIMLTWQQQLWMCFRATKSQSKTALFYLETHNFLDLQVKPARVDVTCKFWTFFSTGSWRFWTCTFMCLHIYEQIWAKMCSSHLWFTVLHEHLSLFLAALVSLTGIDSETWLYDSFT